MLSLLIKQIHAMHELRTTQLVVVPSVLHPHVCIHLLTSSLIHGGRISLVRHALKALNLRSQLKLHLPLKKLLLLLCVHLLALVRHLLLLLHHHGIHHRIIPLHHRLHARLHHTHLRFWVNSTRFNCGITISCFKLLHFLYFFNNYNVQLFKIKIDNYVILFQLIYH